MGHTVGKDIYRELGRKIDGLNVRVPWNETLHAILKELYSQEEADLVVQMPSGLATLLELEQYTRFEPRRLRPLLEILCAKGLVVDVFLNDAYYYSPSPLVIGIFEFTMMRTDGNLDIKKISKLFHDYMSKDTLYAANFKSGRINGLMRTIPYEESFETGEPGEPDEDYVEVLDYEKATAIIEQSDLFSIGYCSCRHEKHHAGAKKCDTPLETCVSIGYSADYLIRNNLSRRASKTEMLEHIARSKELGLVINGDNVKRNCQFMCHCCKCGCNVLQGVSKFGYPATIVTSSYIAQWDSDTCVGCGICAKVCGVDAITMTPAPDGKKKKGISLDKSVCLGCGVCVVKCPKKALSMTKRERRVLHPETTFEKAILKYLEKGTLQDQLFTNPKSINQKVLRGIVGGFLRLTPVKRALMSEVLRSSFLNVMKKGAQLQGKGWLTDL